MNSRFSAYFQRIKAHRLGSTITIVATLALGILIGTVATHSGKGKALAGFNSSDDATPLAVPAPKQLSSAFAQISKQIEPSVVNINTDSTIKTPSRKGGRRSPGGGGGDDQSMQDFFDRFFGGQGGPDAPGGDASPDGIHERSLGSGVIVDPKGYIITNEHVVDRADRVRVQLQNDPPGTLREAKVIGVDRETDLAVIKIEAKDPLPAAKLGNSD